jgi:thiamine biosynthesis lipoprotein
MIRFVAIKRSSIAPDGASGQPAMRYRLVLLVLIVSLTRSAVAETRALRGAAQGTTYHIKFVAPASDVNLRQLQAGVERQLREIDRQMSTYRSDSEISRFNRAPAREWFSVSPATAKVVAAAQVISEKTSGALDITVGPLVRLWHFGPRSDNPPSSSSFPKADAFRKRTFRPPAEDELQAAVKRIGYSKLEVRMKPPGLRKQIDDLEVDLSSIASGYTIDRLAELLSKRGIENFMVELGGEVRAAGKRDDRTAWRVAIERPTTEKREIALAVPLANASLATAGGTRKFFEYQGRRYSHIINPATGRPVEHALASVTVAADRCIDADGWDTPLLVLGPVRGLECAERNGIAALFIWHSDDAQAADTVRATTAWRMRFADTPLPARDRE